MPTALVRLRVPASAAGRERDVTNSRTIEDKKVSKTLEKVRELVARGELRISIHGYDELAADDVPVRSIVAGLETAVVVEDYPTFGKGPCVLVLQMDAAGQPIHVVWGIPKGQDSPAVVITAYRPDPAKWDETWQRRRR